MIYRKENEWRNDVRQKDSKNRETEESEMADEGGKDKLIF